MRNGSQLLAIFRLLTRWIDLHTPVQLQPVFRFYYRSHVIFRLQRGYRCRSVSITWFAVCVLLLFAHLLFQMHFKNVHLPAGRFGAGTIRSSFY